MDFSWLSDAWDWVDSTASSVWTDYGQDIKDVGSWGGKVANNFMAGSGNSSSSSSGKTSRVGLLAPKDTPSLPTNDTPINAKKSAPAATVDPQEVANYWAQTMNKYAAITQAVPK